jgi:hypothetical protein
MFFDSHIVQTHLLLLFVCTVGEDAVLQIKVEYLGMISVDQFTPDGMGIAAA